MSYYETQLETRSKASKFYYFAFLVGIKASSIHYIIFSRSLPKSLTHWFTTYSF